MSTAQYARILDENGALVPASVTASLDVTGAPLLAQGRISRDGAATGQGLSGRLIFAQLASARGFQARRFCDGVGAGTTIGKRGAIASLCTGCPRRCVGSRG